MMTNEQSAIFSQVLDTNWEIKELIEAGKFVDALPKVKQLNELKATLRRKMITRTKPSGKIYSRKKRGSQN